MEVEVKLFASFREGRFKCKRLTFDGETKIIDILNSLNIKIDEIGLVLINGAYCNTDAYAKDNDVLAIFPPAAGG